MSVPYLELKGRVLSLPIGRPLRPADLGGFLAIAMKSEF